MTQTPQTNQSTEHFNLDKLNAFIDGELPPAERQGIEQHLTGCHACAMHVLSATQLKAATARAGRRFAPPPEALARFTAHLHSQPQTETRTKKPARIYSMTSLRPLAWAALAAAILLTVSLFGWRQLHQTNTLAAELLDLHLATLSSGATPQVISTDRHTVKPWFQGKLPFSFNLPEPDALPADTALKGANLTYLNDQPAALLLFTLHKHEVSVFLTPRTGISLPATPRSTRSGFTIHTVAAHDLLITAVSDVNPTELDALLATLVRVQ